MLFKVCLPQSSEFDRQLLCACLGTPAPEADFSLSLILRYGGRESSAEEGKRLSPWQRQMGPSCLLRVVCRTFSFLFMGKRSLLTCFLNRNKIS